MTTVNYTDQIHKAIKEAISEHMARVEQELTKAPEVGYGPQLPIATIRVTIKKTRRDGLLVCWRAKLKFNDQSIAGDFPLESPNQGLIDFQKEAA